MNWARIFFETDLFTGISRRTGTFRRKSNWPGPMYIRQARWRRHLLLLTSQVAAIVRCNAPLITGIERAIGDGPPLKLTQALIALHDDLASGCSLAEAMARRPRFYPRWYVDIVRAGESTGTLPLALKAAGDHLAESMQYAASIKGWIAYVSVVLAIQLFMGVFLFIYIIPEFAEILREFGARFPHLTLLMIDTFSNLGPIRMRYVVLALVLYVAIKMARMRIGQRGFDFTHALRALLMPFPIIGSSSRKLELARVCAVLERLTEAKVPLNEALTDCAELDINPLLGNALYRTRSRVERGGTLGAALNEERVFPRSFVTLLTLGEASGKLPEAAAQLRGIYEQEVTTSIQIVINLIGPACVLGLGAITFLIYGGVFSAFIAVADSMLRSIQ